MDQAALGFRVKSGWAIAVLVAGRASSPKVVDRREILLADPAIPESRQPYHAALGLPKKAGAKVVARLVKVVARVAGRSLADLLTHYRDGGARIRRAGIVVGSDVDPSTIQNDHIRAHAEEGRLFRIAIEDAAKKLGLRSTITVERQLFAKASTTLRRPARQLKDDVVALGRELGGRWRAEEKAATLAAWTLLPPHRKK